MNPLTSVWLPTGILNIKTHYNTGTVAIYNVLNINKPVAPGHELK